MGHKKEDDLDGMADSTMAIDVAGTIAATQIVGGPGRVQPLPSGPKPWLELVIEGQAENDEIFVITKPLVLLGRVPNVADIVVQDDKASRHHAAIAHQDGHFVLYDMDSTNGTYVDDERITKVELEDGDVFRIGATRLMFKAPD